MHFFDKYIALHTFTINHKILWVEGVCIEEVREGFEGKKKVVQQDGVLWL